MVRKTVPQRNNIHKKRIAVVVCGGKWLLKGAGVEVAKVGGQVGGEGGVRNQRFTGEDAPGHAEFLVFPSLPQQGPAELALKHIPVLSPPPSCQSQEYIVHCGCGCLCHTFIELSLCGSHYFSDSVCTEVYEVGYSPSDYSVVTPPV